MELKTGDLISLKDGTLGLVLGPGYVSPVIKNLQTMQVLWADDDQPTEIDVIAVEKGWATVV